jgi:hypothetical protein
VDPDPIGSGFNSAGGLDPTGPVVRIQLGQWFGSNYAKWFVELKKIVICHDFEDLYVLFGGLKASTDRKPFNEV